MSCGAPPPRPSLPSSLFWGLGLLSRERPVPSAEIGLSRRSADGLRVLCTPPADDVQRKATEQMPLWRLLVHLRDVPEAWLRNPWLRAPWAEERCVFWLPGDSVHADEVSESRLS